MGHAEVLPFIALRIDLCLSCVNFARIGTPSWTGVNSLKLYGASVSNMHGIMYAIKALATATVPCLDVLKISVGIDVGSSTPRPARRVGSANNCIR